MKLITDGNNNWSFLTEDGEIIATNMYSLVAPYFLDLEQISTLLPIFDDDEFEIESIGIKNGDITKQYINLRRSLWITRNKKIEEILKKL